MSRRFSAGKVIARLEAYIQPCLRIYQVGGLPQNCGLAAILQPAGIQQMGPYVYCHLSKIPI